MNRCLLCIPVILICSACSSSFPDYTLDSEYIGYTDTTTSEITGSGNEFYLVDNNDYLYYLDDSFKPLKLTSLLYTDDKPASQSRTNTFSRYTDLWQNDIYFYGDKLYYLSCTVTIENDLRYYLNSLNRKGEDRKRLMEIPYVPVSYVLQEGKLVIIEEGDPSSIHIYNQSCKEIKVIETDAQLTKMYICNEKIYIHGFKDQTRFTYVLDLDDLSISPLDNHEIFIMADEKRYLCRTLDRSLDQAESSEDVIHTYTIYDLSTNHSLFSITDEVISFFNDSYVYTTVLKEENTIFRIYDYEKNLIREIIPSDFIEADSATNVLMMNKDFDQILRIIHNVIITRTFSENKCLWVKCSIDDGMCKVFLEEDNYE